MSQIVIISNKIDGYSQQRLQVEAQNKGLNTHFINPQNCFIEISKTANITKVESILIRSTGVTFDDVDLTLADNLSGGKIPIHNNIELIQKFRSKDLQMSVLSHKSLPIIPTFVLRGKSSLENLSKISNGPYILKTVRGNQGRGVIYLENKKSLLSLLETFQDLNDQRFILQPFLFHKKEYRVFVINKKVIGAIEKQISDRNQFKMNAHNTFEGKYIPSDIIPKKINSLVEDLVEKFDFTYAGLDVFIADNKAYLCEVNLSPGFEHFEKYSKKNIANYIIQASLRN